VTVQVEHGQDLVFVTRSVIQHALTLSTQIMVLVEAMVLIAFASTIVEHRVSDHADMKYG